jgi:RNA polymerase sigma-70 factor (ECF subfamily)
VRASYEAGGGLMGELSGHEQLLTLLISHQQRLAGFVRTLVPNRADAEEVLQEVCLYIWRHADEFQLGTDFAAWAFRVAHFHVLTWRKRQSRDRLVFDELLVDQLATDAQSLDEHAERQQAALEECLNKLIARDREIISLRYELGATTQEVADKVGRNVKTLYATLNRIRLSLLECIEHALATEERD